MMRTEYPDTKAGAIACITDNAVEEVAALTARQIEDGTCEWVADSEVAGVWGLVLTGTTKAQVVVYCTAGDFEVSDEFEEAAR